MIAHCRIKFYPELLKITSQYWKHPQNATIAITTKDIKSKFKGKALYFLFYR